jgi:DNA-binding transcriptional LysR family regulator
MDKLDAMNAFAKVVAAGSYAEAARRLGLTRSAVSKAVMELEQLLGARLLDRTTRRVAPTEAGLAYYERCVSILADVEETEIQISRLHDEPRGVLKINAPMSFGTLYLGDAVAEFMVRYPEMRIELVLNDRFIDPLEEGVDVTVRIGALGDSSLIARRLAPARRALVASPGYIERHGAPQAPQHLARHRCLAYGHMAPVHRWQLMQGDEAVTVQITSALCSNNGEVLRTAALAGNGVANLPTFLVGPDIAAGRLTAVLPDNPPTELGIFALYAPNRYLAAKTRVFIDFLVARFGEAPAWDAFRQTARQ